LSDFARSRGRRIEPKIFEELGGKPSVVMLRHGDMTFDVKSKTRYLNFLGSKVGEAVVTEADERKDPVPMRSTSDAGRGFAKIRATPKNSQSCSMKT